ATQSYQQRFPLLSYLGIILCFILFPAGLINLGLDQMLQIKEANSREDLAHNMDNGLKKLARFSDNEYFAHYLLLGINDALIRSTNPQQTFFKLKNRLQKHYPESFTFVFWNGDGE